MPIPFLTLDNKSNILPPDVIAEQALLGDDLVLTLKLGALAAGDGKDGGKILDLLLFNPIKFLNTDLFLEWYKGAAPFADTTVSITWNPDLSDPVVIFIRGRSLISIVMPVKQNGEFVKLLKDKHFADTPEDVTVLLHTASGGKEAAYFHYTFGDKVDGKTDREVKQNCIRAMVWDPRSFLHSIDNARVKPGTVDPLRPGPTTVSSAPVEMPRANSPEEMGSKLTEKIRRMSLSIQLNAGVVAFDENEPLLPRCNIGQAVYDPSTGDFVLNSQHYTLANWPRTAGSGDDLAVKEMIETDLARREAIAKERAEKEAAEAIAAQVDTEKKDTQD